MTSIHFGRGESAVAYTVKRDGKYMSVGGELTDEAQEAFVYAMREKCEKLIETLKEKPDLKDSEFEIVELTVECYDPEK